MRKVDIIASIVLIAFAGIVAFVVIPGENPGGVWHGLSPYFYPMVMLGGIALSSVGLLIQALTKPGAYADQPMPMSWAELGFFALVSVIVLAGVLLIHWKGTWIGGPVLVAAVMIFMGELRPQRILPVAILTVAVTHVIVTYGLKIPLP